MRIDDRTLVAWCLRAQAVEREVRRAIDGAGADAAPLRDVLRHATATRKSLEGWIVTRQKDGVAVHVPDAPARSV